MMESYMMKKAERNQLPAAMELINDGKQYLKEQGSDQWQTGYPDEADILEDMAPRRVFLLLGLNDLSLLTQEPEVPRVVEQYARLVALVESAVPGAQVVVISNPPKLSSSWLPDYTVNRRFDNQLIGEFVAALGEMCREKGVPYVDAYALLADESGALPEGYCRDGYVHLNNAGAKIVVDALYQFASQEA